MFNRVDYDILCYTYIPNNLYNSMNTALLCRGQSFHVCYMVNLKDIKNGKFTILQRSCDRYVNAIVHWHAVRINHIF